MKKLLRFEFLVICFLILLVSNPAVASKKKFSRDELKHGFDVVAQNFGALQYAYYTFSLEFERPPNDINELKSSGHFRVKLINPYSKNKPVVLGAITDRPIAAALYYSKSGEKWGDFLTYFINPNKPDLLRSLVISSSIFTHEELHKSVFGDDASREEQLTRVYLLQLNDAIDSFEQRYGRMPDSLDEMAEIGDVNVNYINPFTDKLVKNKSRLSPGDYMYRRITSVNKNAENTETGKKRYSLQRKYGNVLKKTPPKNDDHDDSAVDEDFYEVIGWGETAPIYYYSNDTSREYLGWSDSENDN